MKNTKPPHVIQITSHEKSATLSPKKALKRGVPSGEFPPMPLQYMIIPPRRLVVSRDALPITRREIMQFFRDLSADPRFQPTFDQLHHVCRGALAAMHYNDLSSLKESDPFAATSRRAFVVQTKADFGLARMYELMRGGCIRIFESEREALDFLGVRFGEDPSTSTIH